ncbi:hypothetical protein DPMN_115209 [Dreissena polymorpha]|uniref:Uncharacterized protein n=1 Tax=Dreissena polymorpha TaxID=45954 RepID=A0A9D4KLJ2_DREPO|nr:hypothetical protein DPMN_115209 [Dreissena polymorpha]
MAWQRPTRVPTTHVCPRGRPRIDRIVIRDIQSELSKSAWSMWAGAPQVEIDRIIIRDIQYQFEVNRCRNEEVIVKGNLGLAWSIYVQYQLEVNRCRNEEVYFQGSSAYSVGEDSGQDERTDGRKTKITTISPLFLRKAWG